MKNKTNDKINPKKFQDMAKLINHYLKDENITLTFQGYNDTISSYFKINDNDLYEAFNLAVECNLWNNYFADIEGIIQVYTFDIELSLDKIKAQYDKNTNNDILDNEIKLLTKKLKDFKIFLKQVGAQKNFFDKAHFHCNKLYLKGNNTLAYKKLD
ncbi:MAG: hypothetical protein K0R54_28 [Clostridiaceae bacterium]|jgi:hypothetical protein|nr:hypothetical protein [Clostridiaceae bacterium]